MYSGIASLLSPRPWLLTSASRRSIVSVSGTTNLLFSHTQSISIYYFISLLYAYLLLIHIYVMYYTYIVLSWYTPMYGNLNNWNNTDCKLNAVSQIERQGIYSRYWNLCTWKYENVQPITQWTLFTRGYLLYISLWEGFYGRRGGFFFIYFVLFCFAFGFCLFVVLQGGFQ